MSTAPSRLAASLAWVYWPMMRLRWLGYVLALPGLVMLYVATAVLLSARKPA